MLRTTNQAVSAANSAFDGMISRHISDLTNQPLESESLFEIRICTKKYDVKINTPHSAFFASDFKKIDKHLKKYILAIEPQPWCEKSYQVTALAFATPEQIESELERYLLPF